MDETNLIIRLFSIYSPAIPLLIAGVLIIQKNFTKSLLPILLLIVAGLVCDQLALFLAHRIKNSMPASHLYGLIHGVLLVWFFYTNLSKKKILVFIGAAYLAGYVLNSLFFEPVMTFNTTAKVIQNVLFIGLSLFYFFELYAQEHTAEIEKNGVFWMVVGILFYHVGSLFTFLLSQEILTTRSTSFYGTWILHNSFNILKNLIFSVAIWISRPH